MTYKTFLCAKGKEPDFQLMEFIQHHVMMSNTRFGQIMNSRKSGVTAMSTTTKDCTALKLITIV